MTKCLGCTIKDHEINVLKNEIENLQQIITDLSDNVNRYRDSIDAQILDRSICTCNSVEN